MFRPEREVSEGVRFHPSLGSQGPQDRPVYSNPNRPFFLGRHGAERCAHFMSFLRSLEIVALLVPINMPVLRSLNVFAGLLRNLALLTGCVFPDSLRAED